jgi:integrase
LKRIEGSPWAAADMATMKRKNVRDFLDDMTSGPAAWNNWLKILRVLINHANEQEVMDNNPTLGIKKNAEGLRRAWTDAERAQFEARWPAGTRQRLAYSIALCTGQRRGDIAAMTWDNIISVLEKDYLHVVQEKTGQWLIYQSPGLLALSLMRTAKATGSRTYLMVGD